MNILGFTPNDSKGQEFYYNFVFLFSLLTLPGCMASSTTIAPLAPEPPVVTYDSIKISDATFQPNYFAAHSTQQKKDDAVEPHILTLDENVPDNNIKCSIKDRFDRKAVLAYEWNRSRLSFDVDGLGDSDDAGMRLEYKIRLQPEKTKKQKCRYQARWQGLIGSGYNELVVRQDDTVWQALREKRSEATEFLGVLF